MISAQMFWLLPSSKTNSRTLEHGLCKWLGSRPPIFGASQEVQPNPHNQSNIPNETNERAIKVSAHRQGKYA